MTVILSAERLRPMNIITIMIVMMVWIKQEGIKNII
jgi:hypothetical protein